MNTLILTNYPPQDVSQNRIYHCIPRHQYNGIKKKYMVVMSRNGWFKLTVRIHRLK